MAHPLCYQVDPFPPCLGQEFQRGTAEDGARQVLGSWKPGAGRCALAKERLPRGGA